MKSKNFEIGAAPITPTAFVFAVLLCIMFGANTVAGKFIMKGFGQITTAGVRFSISGVAIFLWCNTTGRSLLLTKEQFLKVAIAAFIFLIQLSCFYKGLNTTDAGRAVLIINVQPVYVLFLAHFFIPGDSITFRKIIGMSLSLIGLYSVLTSGGKVEILSGIHQGDIFLMINTLLWAVSAVYIKRIIHGFKPYQIVFYQNALAAPFFLLGGFVFDDKMVIDINLSVILAVIYLGVITSSLGFIGWNTLQRKYKTTTISSFSFIMPISGILAGNILLNEPFTIDILFSMIMIVGGIIIVNVDFRKFNIFIFRR